MPVLANLFGTAKRVALGMGEEDVDRRCAKSASCWPTSRSRSRRKG